MRRGRLGKAATLFATLFLGILASCSEQMTQEPDVGVPREMARERAGRISDLIYSLTFHLPGSPDERVEGSLVLSFVLSEAARPLVVDFRAPSGNLETVTSGGKPIPYEFRRGQIVLSPAILEEGRNIFEFGFRSTDVALNRREDYLYTLFVPDRAATAFPCFDQPDLKGRYRLVVDLPQDWQVLANGSPSGAAQIGDRLIQRFRETEPLSTYQFAFAAGRFQMVERTVGGRSLRMFHRETDDAKLGRNLEAIFDLHAEALRWLEDYTGIPLPFQKLDFILLPAFQFGGMEHPGAIYYRDSHLLLEPSATRTDELRRASLIAHETSHMWFGNLVTMRWFNDVWMKEVFANFMAAKIVNPAFPEIDHELRFLLAHQPVAYAVDRSLGTHPIRQQLDNLNHAASLYGPIIYQKAPAVMRQLEVLVGPAALQEGLRDYLDRFRYGNADWNDLVKILDELSAEDVRAWSRVWIEEAGRPTVTIRSTGSESGETAFEVHQADPLERDLSWSQELHVTVGLADGIRGQTIRLKDRRAEFEIPDRIRPSYVLPSSDGLGYGFFRLDAESSRVLLSGIPKSLPSAARAAAWISLWDGVLAGDVEPRAFVVSALRALGREPDELLQEHLLDRIAVAFWSLDLWRDSSLIELAEPLLWQRVEGPGGAASKLASLRAYAGMVRSDQGANRLYRLWKGEVPVEGLELGETDAKRIALELALRKEGEQATRILDEQFARLQNPERRDEFEFVRRAVSPSEGDREALFQRIVGGLGTVRENWSLEGLHYLTHPLRGAETEPRVLTGLRLLPQVESTGSIFFPQRWLDELLWGQSSPKVARLVRDYLRDSAKLSLRLRRKVLQSADVLLRITGVRDSIERPGKNE